MTSGFTLLALSLGVAVSLPFAASAQVQPVQSYDSYKSWLVACDNVLSCEAKGFGDGDARAELNITRDMGPAGALRLTIAAEGKFTIRDLKIDGEALSLRASDWTAGDDGDSSWVATTDLAAARALVSAARDGQSLQIGGTATVPLDGFAAAALRLDERQSRLGGVTALLRPGPLPASRVPAAKPVPFIPNRPVSARLAKDEDKRLIARTSRDSAAIFKAEDCFERDGVNPTEAFALDSGRALVFIPCLLGAYQSSSLAFIVPRGPGGKISRVVLAAPYAGNTEYARPIDMFTEGSFDPETGTIFTAAKGRGLADCGFSASWVWTGTQMVLTDMSIQQSCGGIEPGDWPTLFRSRQK